MIINRKSIEKKLRSINIKGFIIFLIHFFITCYTDTNIFQGEYTKKILYIVVKLIATIAMFIFWQYVFKVYYKLKEKDEYTKIYFQNFCIYFIPMVIFLILTWPGVWRCDEFNLIDTICNMKLMYWQHWLTDVYYIFCLCIIGFPVSVVIIQILIISFIVAYIVTEVYNKISKKYAWLIYIPLFFPTVISNNLYPLRLPLYSFLELLFLFIIIDYHISNKKVGSKQVLIFSFLIAILATWRSEAIFYIILGPTIISILLGKKLKVKVFSYIMTLTILLFTSITFIQRTSGYSASYSLSAISYQLGEILKTDFKSNSKEHDLEIINKVFPVDEYLNSGNTGGGFIISYVLNNNCEHTDSNFKHNVFELKKVYVKLVFYNFPEYIKASTKSFLITSGFTRNYNSSVADSSAVFDEGYIYTTNSLRENINNSYYFCVPINNNLRTWTIRFLECRYVNNYYKTNFWFNIFYNVVPSILIVIFLFIKGLLNRNKLMYLISCIVLIRPCLLFATAPAQFFMYYLPTYICGYVLGIIYLISKLQKRNLDLYTI